MQARIRLAFTHLKDKQKRYIQVAAGLVVVAVAGFYLMNAHRGAAVANGDGLLFYGASANTTPQYRTYTANDTFSAAAGTAAGTQAKTVVMKTSPTKNEAIAGYVNGSGVLQVMCFDGTAWSNEWSVTVGGTGTTRRFDISYEKTSGKAIVLYGNNGASLGYRTKASSSGCGGANWAAATTFTPSRTTGTIAWVKMAANSTANSNLVSAAWADLNSDLSTRIWSGSAWGQEPTAALATTLEIATAAQDVDSFDLAYETASGDLMVVWGLLNTGTAGGADLIKHATCTGNSSTCTWSAVTSIPTVADAATNIDLAADPTTDRMSMAAVDNGSLDMSAGYWTGSAWTGYANVDASVEAATAGTKLVSSTWLTNGSTTRWLVNFDDATGTAGQWYVATPGSAPALQTGYAVSPALNDIRHRYDTANNPFNNAEAMVIIADSTKAVYAKRVTMDAAGAFTWTNADGAASLGTLDQSTVGGASFAYWRYIAPPGFGQAAYRVFANADSTTVGSALANQDAAAILPSTGSAFRIHMLLDPTDAVATNSSTFKLQFVDKGTGSCAAPSGGTPASYTDISGTTAISFKDNASVADAATAVSAGVSHGGETVVPETYEEANNFTIPTALAANNDGLWDFSLYDNAAPSGKTYCFRAVNSDGTTTNMTYSIYPEVTTYAAATVSQAAYRWFENSTAGAGAGSSPTTTPTEEELFEGQSSGTTMTNTNTIFDLVTCGTGGCTFSDSWSISGTRSAKYDSDAVIRDSFTASAQLAQRWYMQIPANPSAVVTIGNMRAATTVAAQIRLDTDGTVILRNGTSPVATSVSSLPLNTSIRVDWKVDATAGTNEVRFYWGSNVHGSTPDMTLSSATYANGNPDNGAAGIHNPVTGFIMYVDAWAYANDWIGPIEISGGGGPQVGAPLANMDTAATAGALSTTVRLRLNLGVSGNSLATGVNYKLQYAARGADNLCDTSFSGETYGDITASTVLKYSDLVDFTDAMTYTSDANDPIRTNITALGQTYEESNPFATTVAIPAGQDGLWDFPLEFDSTAPSTTSYCVRAITNAGSNLSSYGVVAEIATPTSGGSDGSDTNNVYLRGGQSVINGTKSPYSF